MTKKQKREGRNILIAAVVFLILFVCELTGVFPEAFEKYRITLLLFLIPYGICGFSVLKKAAVNISHGQVFDEAFLMTLATIGAFATGEYAEAAAVMLFNQVGEFFQSYAVGKSRGSIRELMSIAPDFAVVERPDGSSETIDPDEVEIGDILIIMPGEKIPVDGTVIAGSGSVNTSALTGESLPRSVTEGSSIISGCVNGDSLLRIRADKLYQDSTVARILELVESASEKKSKTENFITRFARVYTPAVVIGALLLAFIPPIFAGHLGQWIYRACTFLVISCPCALVISIPLSFFGGIGAASKSGVLVKGSNYLELLSKLDTLVTDKTGTLTYGNFRVSEVLCEPGLSREDVLSTAALAESLSTHPIALSIKEAASKNADGFSADSVKNIENISGKGILAYTDQGLILAGNEALMKENGISFSASDSPFTTVYIAKDGRYCGCILLRDEPKSGVKGALSRIKDAGVRRIVMLTGDRKEVGEAIGREVGTDSVIAELLPQDKVEEVERLLSKDDNSVLAYVGDGINDAPVLARADVGIAMGSLGSDAAIEAADVVIMDDDLNHIPDVMGIAKKTVGISRQNIVFALAVKALVLILGALGIANMWAAVFADVGVAVICILNAMRLLINRKNTSE